MALVGTVTHANFSKGTGCPRGYVVEHAIGGQCSSRTALNCTRPAQKIGWPSPDACPSVFRLGRAASNQRRPLASGLQVVRSWATLSTRPFRPSKQTESPHLGRPFEGCSVQEQLRQGKLSERQRQKERRPVCAACSSHSHHSNSSLVEKCAVGEEETAANASAFGDFRRSQLLRGLLLGAGACAAWQQGGDANAVSGLVSLPPAKLTNEYFLVRAGESEVEAQGHIMTNPVAKTSMDSGLSRLGRQQVLSTIQQLRDMGACNGSCWIWPSITQRAYQTAELVASAFTVGRSRIVPEYSFLDARGLGSYEGRPLAQIQEIYESDRESAFYRPPPFVDGTPNESVHDVLVRVRQLLSILETQYQGDQVLIVSPDSDNLSVLQAAILGMDLRQHASLAFRPGEVRKVVLGPEPPPRPTSGFFKCKQLRNRQWDCAI